MPLHTQASLPSLPVILGIQNFNHYTFLVELDTQPRATFNQHKLHHFVSTPVSQVCYVLRVLYCRFARPLTVMTPGSAYRLSYCFYVLTVDPGLEV